MTTEHDEWGKVCIRDDSWVVRWGYCKAISDTWRKNRGLDNRRGPEYLFSRSWSGSTLTFAFYNFSYMGTIPMIPCRAGIVGIRLVLMDYTTLEAITHILWKSRMMLSDYRTTLSSTYRRRGGNSYVWNISWHWIWGIGSDIRQSSIKTRRSPISML